MNTDLPPRPWGGALEDRDLELYRGTYPHVRGEEVIARSRVSAEMDLPPRPWGGGGDAQPLYAQQGPTPTSVGRSEPVLVTAGHCGTYPHVRGEESSAPRPASFRRDLPPRPWGGVLGVAAQVVGAGPTPTSVGRSSGRHPG